MLPLLSFASQAKAWTGCFTVEFEQNTGFKKQKFSIKPDRPTLSALPGNPSDVTDTRGYGGSYTRPDKKQHNSSGYRVKTTIVASISWHWLYTTNLLVAYELILTTKTSPLSSSNYSWVPVEVVVAVGWLLKSYWNLDSALFNPLEQLSLSEQQETTSLLKQQDHPFASIITVYGSGYTPPQYQPPESSGQQPPQTTPLPIGSLTNPLYSGTGDGNGDPEQILHTLGLNCFVYPCHGICQFRSSPENRGANKWPLNDDAPMSGHLPISSDDWAMVRGLLNLRGHSLPEETGISCIPIPSTETSVAQPTRQSFQSGQSPPHLSQTGKLQASETLELAGTSPSGCFPFKGDTHCRRALTNHKSKRQAGEKTCDVTMGDDQQRPCGTACKNALYLQKHRRKDHTGLQTCSMAIVGKNGQRQPCAKIFKNAQALSVHKSKYHSGQKTCDVAVPGEDGQQQTCGKICRNAQALSDHKSRTHTGQKVCDLTLFLGNGLKRPCGKVCKNTLSLLEHKRSAHARQQKQTCRVLIVGKDGQQQPCGAVCKNARHLFEHRRSAHTGPQTCSITVVGNDDQQRPCGRVYKNAKALSDHKSRVHSGRKTCNVTIVGEDGHQQPCGRVCKSAVCLMEHRRSAHTGLQTCSMIIVEEDGQQRPCGTICKSAKALSDHKNRIHSGQRTCDLIIVGNDGQQRPCGSVCNSVKALSDHKSKIHSGQQICDVIIVGNDGQLRPCGSVCKGVKVLSNHKNRVHTGQQTCDVIAVGKNGQQQPCGKLYKNLGSLQDHKRREHGGQRTCNQKVVGEDGQQRLCGTVCQNFQTLSKHKRIHRKRKPFDAGLNNDPSP
ncbi:hypothetical protein [Endozoicomonas sp. ALD040]|uniref:hypothetical protein n=1 Tax=Endozoicomonas sp. ALD040 TaxID=3403079 RepID=UPI003BAF01C2